jgi:hypothetical protein
VNRTLTSHWCVPGRTRPRGASLSQVPGLFQRFAHRGVTALLTAPLLLMLPVLARAQGSSALSRITAPINESNLMTLRGNTHPLAKPQYDQGAVPDSQPIHRMLLLLQRSADQDAALKQLVDEQQSKSSPNYHQWLTPQQIGQQYGPSDADIQTVTNWLQSHGFQLARVSAAKTLIEFSGTAGQVSGAFHTQIHRYAVNGEVHFANSSDPQIPTALAPVLAGPVSMNNFHRKAQIRSRGAFRKTKATGEVTPLYSYACTGSNGGQTNCNAIGPGDFANIYNVAKLWNTGINGTQITGTGQTIAIVGDSEICTRSSPDWNTSYLNPNTNPPTPVTCSQDDVAQFRTLFGLPTNSPNVIVDGPDPGFNTDETEGDLDVEWSGAVAKNATIDFVIAEETEVTEGTDLAAEYIVDNNLAPILSESFGGCEWEIGTLMNYFEATLWEQAAAQGITVIVAAGDSGSAGCDDPEQYGFADVFGPAVNGIASTPFNVAAGGTDFDTSATNYQSTYWGGPNTQANGYVSATSYIPETTWNDSCAQNFTGTLNNNCTPTLGGDVGGGGGQSNCAAEDNAGNCYYYPKPSWQTLASGSGLTSANDLARDLPDISLFAAAGYISNSFYIICESDTNPNDIQCNLNTPYYDFFGIGGTSSAAPTFAGMMALVNQNIAVNQPSLSPRQGNADYVLYNLASAQTKAETSCNSSTVPNSACTFNDITKGNNSVPCAGGSFGCSNTSTSATAFGVIETSDVNPPYTLTGNIAWNTAPGLDLATGLGSVNAYNLVNNWPTATFTPTSTSLCLSALAETSLASCSSPISITHGQTVYVNVQVSANGSPIPVTETLPTATSTNPTDPFVPSIAEDVALIGTFPSGNPSCSVTGCTTGAVDHFTSNSYSIGNSDIYPLTSGTTVGKNYFTQNLVGGTYNVVAHYTGDGTYGGSNSPAISVQVNPEGSAAAACVMVVNPSTGNVEGGVSYNTNVTPPVYSCSTIASAYYGDVVFLRADVVGTSSGQESATGNATLYDGGVAGVVNPAGVLTTTYPLNSEGYLEDQTTYLGVGAHTFQVKYNGDASYSAMSSPSAALAFTVNAAPTTTKITAPSNGTTLQTASPVTLTVLVDSAYTTSVNYSGGSLGNPPAGTVTFTSSTGSTLGTVPVISTTDAVGYVAATASLTFTPSATTTVTALYTPAVVSGVANYVTSCAGSSPCSNPGVVINVGTPGVNVTPGCSSATILIAQPGQSGTCLITVTGANSFAGTVNLSAPFNMTPPSATDLPTCSFGSPDVNFTAPSTITLSTASETGNATLTCNTTAASGVAFRPANRPANHPPGHGWPLAGAAFALTCLFFLLVVPMQRRWRLVPLAGLLAVFAVAGVSCGGSSGGTTTVTIPGTTTGTYTILVTATPSTGNASSTAITINVQ